MKDVRAVTPDVSVIREQRGVSLRWIADMTKILMFYLEAIENREFEKLPGEFYTRSYIRQYCKAIDFEEDGLLGCVPPTRESEELPAGRRKRS